MPVFRPSTVVNIRLKFDRSLTLLADGEPDTVEARIARASVPTPRKAKPKPLLGAAGAQGDSWVMGRIPKSLTFEKPGYRRAATFNLTIDYRDLPIDPRAVAAAAIEIHTGCVSDADFAQGYASLDGRRRRLSQLQTRLEDGQVNESTLRMYALVDEWEVEHSESGSEVRISGRDLRGVLLDFPIAPPAVSPNQFWDTLDLSKDVQQVVVQMLRFNPLFDDVQVQANPEEWPDGRIPSPAGKGIAPRHRLGATGSREGGRGNPPGQSSGNKLSFWDAIVRVCFLVGAVPYFENQRLLIRPSRSIYDRLRGPVDPVRNPTPFTGGSVRGTDAQTGAAINPPLRVRRMVYGRDISSLTFNRRLGGKKKPTVVRCISLDTDSRERGLKKVLEVFWPPDANRKPTKHIPGVAEPAVELLNFPVPGVKDKLRLTEIAQALYEEIGRSELSGTITTKNLASFGGDASDPDLLRLNPGDAVDVRVDTRISYPNSHLESTFTRFNRDSFESQVRQIAANIGDENLARAIVATARGQVAELQSFFRVQNMRYNWSDSGVKVDFDFQNYVLVNEVSTARAKPGRTRTLSTGKQSKAQPKSLRNLKKSEASTGLDAESARLRAALIAAQEDN